MRKIKKRQMDLSPSKRVVAKRLSLIYILFIGGVGFLSVDLFGTYSEREVIHFNVIYHKPYITHHSRQARVQVPSPSPKTNRKEKEEFGHWAVSKIS